MDYKYKIGFIGAGNMAKSIVKGIIDSNIISSEKIILSKTQESNSFMNVKLVTDNNEVLLNSEFIILAIKPQVFYKIKDIFKQSKARVIISIMAGVKSNKIKDAFNNNNVIRVMPNLPCAIKEGMVGISLNNIQEKDNIFVDRIFSTISKTCYIEENLFDALTSISGSGPAYVYYFIKAMIEGGMKGGLSYKDSKMLTLQTFKGACSMVENSDEELSELINKVCSKGGTTIQAINTFNKYNLDKKIIEGIDNCRIKSEELSK